DPRAGLDRIGVGYRGPNRFGTDFTSSIPIAPLVSCIVAVAIAYSALSAREYRSRELTREFQREHPCPSTGFSTGACPGYRKDHIKRWPAVAPTPVWNLQWQAIADAKASQKYLKFSDQATSLSLSVG